MFIASGLIKRLNTFYVHRLHPHYIKRHF